MGSRNLVEDSGSFLKEIGARARHMLGGICGSLLNTADDLRKNVPKGSRNSDIAAEAHDHDADEVFIQDDPQGSEWPSDLVAEQSEEQTVVETGVTEGAEPLFEELYVETKKTIQTEAEVEAEVVTTAAEMHDSADAADSSIVEMEDESFFDFLPPMKDAERRAPRAKATVIEETAALEYEEKTVDTTENADAFENDETAADEASLSEEEMSGITLGSAETFEGTVIEKHVNVFIDLGEDAAEAEDMTGFTTEKHINVFFDIEDDVAGTVETESIGVSEEDVITEAEEAADYDIAESEAIEKHVNEFMDLRESVTEEAAELIEMLEEESIIETVSSETSVEAEEAEIDDEIAETVFGKHVNVFIDLGDDAEAIADVQTEETVQVIANADVFESYVENTWEVDIEVAVTSMDEGIAASIYETAALMISESTSASDEYGIAAEEKVYEPSLADALPKELLDMFDSEDSAAEYVPMQKYVNVRIVFDYPLQSELTTEAEIAEETEAPEQTDAFEIEEIISKGADEEIAIDVTGETYTRPAAIAAADEPMLISETSVSASAAEKHVNVFFDIAEHAEIVSETIAEAEGAVQRHVNVAIHIDEDEPAADTTEEATFVAEVSEVRAAAEAAPVGGVGFSFASFGTAGGPSISFTWGREPEEDIDVSTGSESAETDALSLDEGVFVSPVSGKENLWL